MLSDMSFEHLWHSIRRTFDKKRVGIPTDSRGYVLQVKLGNVGTSKCNKNKDLKIDPNSNPRYSAHILGSFSPLNKIQKAYAYALVRLKKEVQNRIGNCCGISFDLGVLHAEFLADT